jgi:hypothetical protein
MMQPMENLVQPLRICRLAALAFHRPLQADSVTALCERMPRPLNPRFSRQMPKRRMSLAQAINE